MSFRTGLSVCLTNQVPLNRRFRTETDEKVHMAGSRLERCGTVFTRVRDLIRSGVIKPTDKPIWYDVYKAFPPKRNPLHVKPNSRPSAKKQSVVPEIFYSEDEIRARFYELYGTGSQPVDVSKSNFVSTCQRFVDKYTELKNQSMLGNAALFDETAKTLLREGVILRRRGGPPGLAESRDPLLELKLTDMLAEQHPAGTDTWKTAEDKA